MANTDTWIYRRWDQVPRSSKHPLLTGMIFIVDYILNLRYWYIQNENQHTSTNNTKPLHINK